jgi:hypothetical protein
MATIDYDSTGFTNQDVKSTISFNKTGVTITNADAIPCQGGVSEVSGGTCTFTGNNSFTFFFQDRAGNTGNAVAMVNWIDKSPVI